MINTLLLLFYEFFQTGLFAVGGGLATIPFLARMTDRYDWFTKTQLSDMIAVAESTPGPIGVNTATYAGFRAAGIPGALVATFALVLPSLITIYIIARFLQKFSGSRLVQNAFAGMRPAVTGLIAAAGWALFQIALIRMDGFAAFASTGLWGVVDPKALILFALIMLLTNIKPVKRLHPVVFIGLSAAAGVIFRF